MTEQLVNVKSLSIMPRTEEKNKEIREQAKTKILQAGLKLFANKGFVKTSMSDIAKEAGISKGLTYNYFKNKEDLAESVFELFRSEIQKYMLPISEMQIDIYIPSKFIKMFFNDIKTNGDFWFMYFSFSMQNEIKSIKEKHFPQMMNEALDSFTMIFKQIGIKNAKAEARIFAAIVDGVALHYMTSPETYSLNSVKNTLLEKYSPKNVELMTK